MTEEEVQILFHKCSRTQFRVLVPNYAPGNWYECDLLAVLMSGYRHEYEIKVTRADFKAEFKNKKGKHYRLDYGDGAGPNRFWFLVPKGLIDPAAIPAYAGLRYISRESGNILTIKNAPVLHKRKITSEAMERIDRAFYYRYWTLKEKYVDLKGESDG